ncbi:FAD binding domain-containing protein [Acuticoccus sp. MNP-M23]|uniref:FAD binding domain-containing protein n=1 Tax=Acuticoccus sp. MNP-M23 TaxID=3072793 RepID=UPI002816644F|nr:FAD binding domain-containing protein [Acuticoccus sp. MNP-M23]WMS43067.1 FAD binding domain-containing protein [Acuticoccus sp. MNP-M23]
MPLTVETYPTLSEAARAFAAARAARFMGGGTILMRAVNEADQSFDTLIRTTDRAMTEIRTTGSAVTLGAGVTMASIAASRDTAFLAPVARLIGGPQVRAAATVAGNLFAAAPYGDLTAALMALGATAEMTDGRRQSIDDLIRGGPTRSLVAAVHVPVPQGGLHFRKVSRIKPKGVSVLSVAAVLPRQGGRIENARIVFNGMGARPVRAEAAERALNGQALGASAIAAAAAHAAEGLSPRDDAIATAWYRREVAGVHLRRLLEDIR